MEEDEMQIDKQQIIDMLRYQGDNEGMAAAALRQQRSGEVAQLVE